jgi:hypothetical protein
LDFEAIPREWLVKKVSVQECELEHAIKINIDDGQSVVPFGYQNEKWVLTPWTPWPNRSGL